MAEKLTKAEVVEALAEEHELPKSRVDELLRSYHEHVREAVVDGREYAIQGLLSIKQVVREARTHRNPQNGEKIEVPRHKDVRISASDALRKEVANG